MIKDAFSKPYCVYAHFNGTQIIYIGSGPPARAFADKRSIRWHRMTKRKKISVDILAWFDNRFDAYNHEGELIRQHRPCCNYENNPDFQKPRRGDRIRCVELDMVFDDFVKVLTFFNITVGRLARALSYHTPVKDLHFEWVE
jgi:hypothetical protein